MKFIDPMLPSYKRKKPDIARANLNITTKFNMKIERYRVNVKKTALQSREIQTEFTNLEISKRQQRWNITPYEKLQITLNWNRVYLKQYYSELDSKENVHATFVWLLLAIRKPLQCIGFLIFIKLRISLGYEKV